MLFILWLYAPLPIALDIKSMATNVMGKLTHNSQFRLLSREFITNSEGPRYSDVVPNHAIAP